MCLGESREEYREEVGMGVVDVGDNRFARQRMVEGIRREKAVGGCGYMTEQWLTLDMSWRRTI